MPKYRFSLTCIFLLKSHLCLFSAGKGYYRVMKMKLNIRKICYGELMYDIKCFSVFITPWNGNVKIYWLHVLSYIHDLTEIQNENHIEINLKRTQRNLKNHLFFSYAIVASMYFSISSCETEELRKSLYKNHERTNIYPQLTL